MNESDLQFVQNFILQRTGIVLTAEKRYLVETRLDPIVRQFQLSSLSALVAKLRLRETIVETTVISAMTTNETLFFRDKHPYDVLESLMLPKIAAARRSGSRKIRIWCAACSTGQEPYSISMILDEMKLKLAGFTVEILATDISEKALAQAKAREFSQFEVQRGLPIRFLLKNFTQVGAKWKLNPNIGTEIDFRIGNLLQGFRHLGPFDIIFCRNVLIYFNEATKKDVLKRLSEVLQPDGYLLLGGAETVLGLSGAFLPHQTERSVYVHNGSDEAYRYSLSRLKAGSTAA